jgi:hypothetical protein
MSKLTNYHTLEILNSISDQQIIDSDFGKDNDAEDIPSFDKITTFLLFNINEVIIF